MAGFRPESFPGTEGRWEIPHLIRQDSNLTNGFVGSFKLSPTAVLPANWELRTPSGNHSFIWDIEFSSDTTIEVLIGQAFPPGGFTARASRSVLPSGGPATFTTFGAQVVAPVAMNQIDGFFAPANERIHVLAKSWLATDGSSALIVSTGLVAANCYCTFYWCDVLTQN